jgi:hypothetical protein
MKQRLPVSVPQLAGMRPADRDQVFRSSPAGPIPAGVGEGMALFPLGPLTRLAAGLVRLVAWKGKVFDPSAGDLRNRITPFGFPAIRAMVYKAPSWVDGDECIVLDYSRTSLVARWIRDEIREVAPRTYLGQVFVRRRKWLHFALSFGPRTQPDGSVPVREGPVGPPA